MYVPYDKANEFLTTLFSPYGNASGLLVELRPSPQPAPREWYPLDAIALGAAAKTCVLWAGKWNSYFGVAPRIRRAGDKSAIDRCFWIWCDIDAGTEGPEGALQLLRAASLPEPDIIICSGAGIHVYWLLSEIVLLHDRATVASFESVLKRVVLSIGGTAPGPHADPSAAELARVLRVPGTLNYKYDPPRPVRLLQCDGTRDAHPLVWWRANLPPLPAPPQPKPRTARFTTLALPPETKRLLVHPTPSGERHPTLKRLLAAARYRGFEACALDALAEVFASINGLPYDEALELSRWFHGKATQ